VFYFHVLVTDFRYLGKITPKMDTNDIDPAAVLSMLSNLWFFFFLIRAETARIIAEPTDTHLKRSPAVIGIACHWALRTE